MVRLMSTDVVSMIRVLENMKLVLPLHTAATVENSEENELGVVAKVRRHSNLNFLKEISGINNPKSQHIANVKYSNIVHREQVVRTKYQSQQQDRSSTSIWQFRLQQQPTPFSGPTSA